METKEKKKEGLSRLFEIAGQKKGLLFLAGLLSAGSAVCMLVPYWAVYEVLKELLTHGTSPASVDEAGMIRWGWIAFCGLIGGLVLLYAALMSSHVAAFRILYGLRVRLSEHIGKLSLGYLNNTSTRSHQEDDGAEHRENRGIHRPHDSRFGERSGDGRGDARHLFLAGYMADGGLSGRGAVELRPAILKFHGEEGTGVHEYLL